MRIAIAGGGPGGLYLSILLKRLDPAHEVVVYERNAPDDTFGFGVVFSDETLAAFEAADPESYAEITRRFVRWSEIDVHYRGEVITSGGHGFSALGRKELLQHPADARGASSASSCASAPRSSDARRATWWSPPTASTARCAPLRRRLRAVARPRAARRTSGSAPTTSSTRSRSSSPRPSTASSRSTRYPYSDAMSTFIVETTDGARGSTRTALRGAVRLPTLIENRTRWINFVTVRNAALAPRERRAARRRRAHRALLDRLGHQAGDGGRDRARLGGASDDGDLDAYEAERRPIVESTQRAAQGSSSGSRASGATCSQDAADVRVQPADAQRAGSPTASCGCATRTSSRRASATRAADVHAVPAARAGAGQPRRRLADGHVLARSTARRATSTSSTSARAAIGGAGLVMTEMICTSRRRADHARAAAACTATSTSPPGSGSSTSCTRTRARAIGCAARPRGPQGLDAAAVGGRGPAARRTATGR